MQKANAGVILGKLKKITGGRGDGVMGEELDVQCSVHYFINYIQFSHSLIKTLCVWCICHKWF